MFLNLPGLILLLTPSSQIGTSVSEKAFQRSSFECKNKYRHMGVGVGVSLGPAAGAALAGAAKPLKPTTPGEGVMNEVVAEAEGVVSL